MGYHLTETTYGAQTELPGFLLMETMPSLRSSLLAQLRIIGMVERCKKNNSINTHMEEGWFPSV